MPFAPVHEGQTADNEPVEMQRKEDTMAETVNLQPRVIETKPKPRIVPRKKLEIIRVSQV